MCVSFGVLSRESKLCARYPITSDYDSELCTTENPLKIQSNLKSTTVN